MKRQGFGRIVATSSMLGRQGCGYMGHYCAAKWGVIGLVKSAAIELAPFGITVNAVAPGNIRTPMVVNDAMVQTLSEGTRTPRSTTCCRSSAPCTSYPCPCSSRRTSPTRSCSLCPTRPVG